MWDQTLLAKLQSGFNLSCQVEIRTNLRRSYCLVKSKRIVLSATLKEEDWNWILCHEFAHLLSEHRHPGRGHLHNRDFFLSLCDVISATSLDYPWHKEYKRLQIWKRKLDQRRVSIAQIQLQGKDSAPSTQDSGPIRPNL